MRSAVSSSSRVLPRKHVVDQLLDVHHGRDEYSWVARVVGRARRQPANQLWPTRQGGLVGGPPQAAEENLPIPSAMLGIEAGEWAIPCAGVRNQGGRSPNPDS